MPRCPRGGRGRRGIAMSGLMLENGSWSSWKDATAPCNARGHKAQVPSPKRAMCCRPTDGWFVSAGPRGYSASLTKVPTLGRAGHRASRQAISPALQLPADFHPRPRAPSPPPSPVRPGPHRSSTTPCSRLPRGAEVVTTTSNATQKNEIKSGRTFRYIRP